MGVVFVPGIKDVILTDTDRLVARNADGGLATVASHVILLGEAAGRNDAISNIIALGAFSLDAGLADAKLAGTVGIGVSAGSALTSPTAIADATASNVLIGQNAAAAATFLSSAVVIGGEALASYVGLAGTGGDTSIVIGNEALQNHAGTAAFTNNIAIGWRVARNLANAQGMVNSVLVGDQIGQNSTFPITSCTIIGAQAAANLGNAGITQPLSNTVIGQGAAGGLTFGSQCTIIGVAAGPTANTLGDQDSIVAIGNSTVAYGPKHTVIGKGASTSGFGTVGARSIVIGYQAGVNFPGSLTDICALETFDGGVQNGCLYAEMAKGNVILGRSQQGVDRDTGGAGALQLVKILDGVKGATAPTGGLFLMSIAGQLRAVCNGGIEKILTGDFTFGGTLPAAAANLKGSRAFITNGPAAPVFGAAAAGGGATYTPVYCDGVGWFNG